MFFGYMIFKCGLPENIMFNCSKDFDSQFCVRGFSNFRINHRPSTASGTQTDGQTKPQNEHIEKYIWAYSINGQGKMVGFLQLVEFTQYDSIHHSTLISLFSVNYCNLPTMQFKPPKDLRSRSQQKAARWMAGMEETY
jgi:hypothetical protein